MLIFQNQKDHLLANLEATKTILSVGSAPDATLDSVISLLYSVINTLKGIQGKGDVKPQKSAEAPKSKADVAKAEIPPAPAAKETVIKGTITKNELLEMGVTLSTIREWLDKNKLKKAGKFGMYIYDSELRSLINRYIAVKKAKEPGKEPAPEGDGKTTIDRQELIARGIAKSAIGFWLRTGKLMKTDVKGRYVYDKSVADLIATYKKVRSGVDIPESEARRVGKISRRALIKKGISESAIGFWIRTGKLFKAEEKGYYKYDRSVQDLIDNYRPRRRK
jgi:hypothetical protein